MDLELRSIKDREVLLEEKTIPIIVGTKEKGASAIVGIGIVILLALIGIGIYLFLRKK